MNFLPGPMELILILVIVAMLFGVGKLPEVFGAVGKGIREFRKESTEADKASAAAANADVLPPAAPVAPPNTINSVAAVATDGVTAVEQPK